MQSFKNGDFIFTTIHLVLFFFFLLQNLIDFRSFFVTFSFFKNDVYDFHLHKTLSSIILTIYNLLIY